jgi:hypothetical protein
MAFVVIEQVFTFTHATCLKWAIIDILACSHTSIVHFFFKARVANTFVIVFVYSSGVLSIDTLSFRAALITLAVVYVFTLGQCSELSICLARCGECNNAIHLAICGMAFNAFKERFAAKDKVLGSFSLHSFLRVMRGMPAAFDRFAACMWCVCAISPTCQLEKLGTRSLASCRISISTRVFSLLFEDVTVA